MKMDEGLDTGPIAMQEPIAIAPDLTAGELHDALARLGADLMMRALAAAERGSLQFTPQPQTGVTYAEKFPTRRPASTGRNLGRRFTTVSAVCRHIPVRGSKLTACA